MTTAAKPTFDPAKGGTGRGEKDLSALSKQYSSRDLPSHTKLKHREYGQGTQEEVKSRDFRRELEERERIAVREKAAEKRPGVRESIPAIAAAPIPVPKKPRVEAANLDADDPLDDDSDLDSDDEDDTAELLAELNRIKKERQNEQNKRDAEKRVEEERIRTENILSGNPLLSRGPGVQGSTSTDFKVKRRWDDDVVFKNCAKGDLDKTNKSAFINDCLRSEFHKKFMEKYIK